MKPPGYENILRVSIPTRTELDRLWVWLHNSTSEGRLLGKPSSARISSKVLRPASQFKAVTFFGLSAWSIKCLSSKPAHGQQAETECSSVQDKCGTFYADVDGGTHVVLGCANKEACDLVKELCEKEKREDGDLVCDSYCCDEDLCNVGAVPSFSVLVVSLCSLLAVVPFFKWGKGICQERSISNFPCSLTRNISSRIKNLAFHSLNTLYLTYVQLGECTFWTWKWNLEISLLRLQPASKPRKGSRYFFAWQRPWTQLIVCEEKWDMLHWLYIFALCYSLLTIQSHERAKQRGLETLLQTLRRSGSFYQVPLFLPRWWCAKSEIDF